MLNISLQNLCFLLFHLLQQNAIQNLNMITHCIRTFKLSYCFSMNFKLLLKKMFHYGKYKFFISNLKHLWIA